MIDAILETYCAPLGGDFVAYRNHCHRVARFCHELTPVPARNPEKLAIAAAFHDLGMWTASTWDYLAPSIELARAHLSNNARADWADEIAEIIGLHHKVTPASSPMTEAFRRADLADVSWGLVRSQLSLRDVRAAYREFPDARFHQRLLRRGCVGVFRNPLDPLPMMRW